MYECPNCSSNMKFNIARQAMFCEACGTTLAPEAVKEKTAEENSVMQVTVFTCPQCAGEIVADTNEAMTFCLYCGASTLLDSRLETMERPARIIPFKKDKAYCIDTYKKAVRRSVFSETDIRKNSVVESFRGIYMPFWNYKVTDNEDISFEVEGQTRRRGNYIDTDYHRVDGHIDADYEGFAHDASATFPDRLSEAIMPYDMSEAVDFLPAYMSGFYGDAGDVKATVYRNNAVETASADITRKIVGSPALSRYIVNRRSVSKAIHPTVADSELVMLPVWFMSSRHKENDGTERITYSVINGQTGAFAGEIPVSEKKVTVTSIIIAAAVFALLCLIGYNFMPARLAFISAVLCSIALLMNSKQKEEIYKREINEKDSALRAVTDSQAVKPKSRCGLFIAIDIIVYVAINCIFEIVHDFWFYGYTFINLAAVVVSQLRLVRRMNKLATSPLPQFRRKGGDDGVR